MLYEVITPKTFETAPIYLLSTDLPENDYLARQDLRRDAEGLIDFLDFHGVPSFPARLWRNNFV